MATASNSDELFAAAVEASDDAIATTSLEGVITGWNHAAEELFGFSNPEAIGQHINLVVPEDLRLESKENILKIKCGEKIRNFDTVRRRKDGQRINVSLSISPIRSRAGGIIGVTASVRDNSERIQEQKALRDSEQMAQAIVESSLDAFVQIDENGVIARWSKNAGAVFGWSQDEAVGRNIRDLIITEERRAGNNQRLDDVIREYELGLPGRRYVSPSLRRDGTQILTEISLTPLRRDDRYIINVFLRDITKMRAAEEQLRQAQKMESVGQLTGGIAHDFNNMLTVITGTIDILAEGVADQPELATIATMISDAADRATQMISRLMAFSRQQPLQPCAVDINGLTAEVARLLNDTLGEHVELELVLADECTALVDPNQLSAALVNLAINARDAMPDGGKLKIETSNIVAGKDDSLTVDDGIEAGNYVVIAVSDTGTGIPKELLTRVFEPFFSTKEIGAGTGLGLSMVYGFVNQSQGHVRVQSEVNYGTTFRIYLPATSAASTQIAKSSAAETCSGSETILAVEDNEAVRKYIATQLQSLGYKTLIAANAAEALAIVQSGAAFDLLFTDILMPGQMNGRQLAEEVLRRRPLTKVLFTSGHAPNVISNNGRLDPNVLLLPKPYHREHLARMLRSALT